MHKMCEMHKILKTLPLSGGSLHAVACFFTSRALFLTGKTLKKQNISKTCPIRRFTPCSCVFPPIHKTPQLWIRAKVLYIIRVRVGNGCYFAPRVRDRMGVRQFDLVVHHVLPSRVPRGSKSVKKAIDITHRKKVLQQSQKKGACGNALSAAKLKERQNRTCYYSSNKGTLQISKKKRLRQSSGTREGHRL